jgi:DNA-binding MarR family transcriptional regulator
VLLQLWRAEDKRLRPVELSKAVLLTRSGITRLIQGLEREGLVEKTDCPDDARGFLVALTPAGAALVLKARATHLAGVAELFSNRYTEDETAQLMELLERLPA